MAQAGPLHDRRNFRAPERLRIRIVDRLQGKFRIDPENVNLVGVPDQTGEQKLPLIQSLRKQIVAVMADGQLNQMLRLRVLRRHKAPDQALPFAPEQKVRPEAAVVDGGGVIEGIVDTQLFKTPDIMEQADQPGKIAVLRGQSQASGDPLRSRRHPAGVFHLQADLVVRYIIGFHIFPECRRRAFSVCHIRSFVFSFLCSRLPARYHFGLLRIPPGMLSNCSAFRSGLQLCRPVTAAYPADRPAGCMPPEPAILCLRLYMGYLFPNHNTYRRAGQKTAPVLGILTYVLYIYKYLSNTFDENS